MNHKPIIQTFQKYKKFLITTHINPDADAIASALALAIVLKSLGKTVTVVNEHKVPDWLKFLPKAEWVKKAEDIKRLDYDVAVTLDCGDCARIGKVAKILREEKVLINIDHHKTNDAFGDLNLVLPGFSSTAEILYGLFQSMRVRWSKDLAMLIYAGIMTDTGSFRYDCTSSQTHRIVGELMDFGISPSGIYTKIYDEISMKDLKLFLAIANQVEFLKNGTIACLELRNNALRKFSDGFDIRDKIFGLLRSTKGVEVIVIFNEIGVHKTRVNFRSKGNFDVACLAAQFNGGGHAKASGCTVDLDLVSTRRKILKALSKGL